MARPTDWTVLDQYTDPVPGSWSQVSSASSRYGRVADAIQQAQADLTRVFEEEGLQGEAIDALRDVAVEVADRIGRAHARYRGVADALEGYVDPLRTAQDDSVTILNTALDSRDARNYAYEREQYWEEQYQRELQTGNDQADLDYARERRDYWSGKLDDANNAITTGITRLNAVIEARDTAANTAGALIAEVENTGGINDDFWDEVDQFLTDNPWIDTALTIAGYVAAALALIALIVPGLNLIVLAVSIVVAAAVIVNAWAKAGTGRSSIGEAIFTTALALLPFGVGRIAGALGGAVRTGAGTSMMASATRNGFSGVTRPVVTGVVDAFMTRGVWSSSGFGELLRLTQLARMPITLAGNVSGPASQAFGPFIAMWTTSTALDVTGPLIDEFFGNMDFFADLPVNSWQNADW